MSSIFLVAEIGCNHNGSRELARRMVEEAKRCGVDAVKFQTFRAEALISRFAPKAEYQKRTTGSEGSQLEMTRKLELAPEDYLALRDYAQSLDLEVFSTAFDMPSVDFLAATGQKIWKIPSGEITNLPYLQKISRLAIEGKRVILSTGMSSVEEISRAVDILLENMDGNALTLLHCNTEYPTPDDDVNLSAIRDLQVSFPYLDIGFSDHSVGFVAAVGAAAMGACMIEKHFTLSKDFEGPDHKASATPEELTALCRNVRRLEVMRGRGGKRVTDSERRNRVIARKSIMACRNIARGEVFTEENITCKRPGNGISPMQWYALLGKRAERDFGTDELIEASGFAMQGE